MRRVLSVAVAAAVFLGAGWSLEGTTAAIAHNGKVHAGEFCSKTQHGKHLIGEDGIELICRGPIHHRYRWYVYIAAPKNPNPYVYA